MFGLTGILTNLLVATCVPKLRHNVSDNEFFTEKRLRLNGGQSRYDLNLVEIPYKPFGGIGLNSGRLEFSTEVNQFR